MILRVERCAFVSILRVMTILRMTVFIALLSLSASALAQDDLDRALVPNAAELKVIDAIKSPDLTVVHLWAPWCSNCQAELKSGGWLKMMKSNPQVKFYFVSVWNDGGDGKSVLAKFQIAEQSNVTILADAGPRRGDNKLKEFAGMPLSWIPTTWVYKDGDLRYALNYGEVRFDVLQQFLEDSNNEWSHKGEPKLPE
jgi:thiol-disulfide isomerase/thioredoxin